MEQFRTIAKRVVESERFLKLSPSARAFYYQAIMNTDKEGFACVSELMQKAKATFVDVVTLINSGFVKSLEFHADVIFIVDWHEHKGGANG